MPSCSRSELWWKNLMKKGCIPAKITGLNYTESVIILFKGKYVRRLSEISTRESPAIRWTWGKERTMWLMKYSQNRKKQPTHLSLWEHPPYVLGSWEGCGRVGGKDLDDHMTGCKQKKSEKVGRKIWPYPGILRKKMEEINCRGGWKTSSNIKKIDQKNSCQLWSQKILNWFA